MLLNYSFQNFRSYRDAQQFSMERSKSAQKRDSATWGHNNVSVVTGVYGGNASGKSAFLNSIRFVARYVARGFSGNIDLAEELSPFLLDND